MRFYFVLTIYGLTICLSGCASGIASQESKKPVTPAKPNAVVALGRIQPHGEVIKLSVANAQDSRVDRILIDEGDFVKRNQVIAVLQGIDRKQADLRDALADVNLRQIELGIVTAKAVRTLSSRCAQSHHVKNQTDRDIYESDFLTMTNIAQSC
jgi:multidrug efflux pump subunit AcrA (membrane-fusion protein)